MSTMINLIPAVPVAAQHLPVQRRNAASASALLTAANENVLLSALGQTASADESLLNIADILDLSPQAQNEISFFNLVSGANTNVVTGGASLTLTVEQRTQFDDIVAKYKDAPFNGDTYAKILADLAAAGLSPEQLALQTGNTSLSLAALFLNALDGGGNTDFFNIFSTPLQQDNTTAFSQQVISQWESVSTQFNPLVYATNPLIF